MSQFVCPACGDALELKRYHEAANYFTIDKESGKVSKEPYASTDLDYTDELIVSCTQCYWTDEDDFNLPSPFNVTWDGPDGFILSKEASL